MISWVWFGWVASTGFESSWFDSGYAAGVKPVCMVLAIGGIPVSIGRFWLQV
jgi:hypothetical protein